MNTTIDYIIAIAMIVVVFVVPPIINRHLDNLEETKKEKQKETK